MEIIGRLTKLSFLLTAALQPVFVACGLQGGEFNVLETLRRAGTLFRLKPIALHEATMLLSGETTAVLDRLEARSLIRRLPKPQDRRTALIDLTDHSPGPTDSAIVPHEGGESRLLAGPPPGDRAALNHLLARPLAPLP